MTNREVLAEYENVVCEIKQLKDILNDLRKDGDNIVHDTVSGSSPEFPYTKHTIHIEGRTNKGEYERLIQNQHDKLMELKLQAEKYINSVSDGQVRIAMRYRYVNGLSWGHIARLVGGKNSADSIRMMVTRYFE